jgi:diguanylate cyclase (GGDEF)-like protein
VEVDAAAPPAGADESPPRAGDERAEIFEKLEAELVDEVTDSIAGAETGTDIGVADAAGALADIADLKKLLVKGLDELIREQSQLKTRLAQAGARIQQADAERKKLATDLSKARKHAYNDDLTGLAKRDGFVRQLEAEIGRASRYGFAVAVALIDIDGLSAINEAFGREGGDKVLRYYATEVLSRFRGYDLVARYGGDEFAVLFPNTQKSGALRALEKARSAASGTYITLEGRSVPLPTFSSVLTMYAHGEQPLALLKRADEALDHAKRSGSDRVVMALLEH